LDHGIGIVQLPCPEQRAWGGVLKRWLRLLYGSKGTFLFRLGGILLPALVWYTRRIYRRLARATVDQIQYYQKAGMTVLDIIGIDPSPSCGVHKTLDLRMGLEEVARIDRNTAFSEDANRILKSTVISGQGLYVEELRKELARRGLRVAMTADDVMEEMEGKTSSVDVGAMIGREC
jgi:hypothetical protein